MNREIYKVFATQIVTSDTNPQGVLSDIPNYPKAFDSRDYKSTEQNPNGDQEIAFLAAQAEFTDRIVKLATADSPTRVGWTVSIIRAGDGKLIAVHSWGRFPDMTPPPPPETQTTEQNQGEGE